MRAALYLRVSTSDRQTTENQRRVLAKVAEHRGWEIVQTYEDFGISGAKGRDKRPAFDQMLKDAVRRKFDVMMCWSIDRLGRSVLHVANAMAELDAAGVALYSCLLYTSDAADDLLCVDLGGRRIIKKKKKQK